MACSKCGQKKAAQNVAAQAVANNVSPKVAVAQRANPLGQNFITKRYIGETGMLNSVLANMSYGNRKKGEILTVAEIEVVTNPEQWQDVDAPWTDE